MAERLYRVFGVIVGLGLAVITAIFEVTLSPLTFGGSSTRVPVAVVMAIACNYGLVYFTHYITRSVGLALVPAIGWFAVLLMASSKTSDGDLLLPGDNYVGVLTLFLGSLTWAVAAYRLLTRRPPPATPIPPSLPRDKVRTWR